MYVFSVSEVRCQQQNSIHIIHSLPTRSVLQLLKLGWDEVIALRLFFEGTDVCSQE